MKTASTAMKAHLASEVTTLCTCWKVVRKDGYTLGVTDHDTDLVIDGVTYASSDGYNRSAISNDGTWSVDNLDVTGFMSSDRITEDDLRNGAFDGAEVFVFIVNWNNLSAGPIKLRRGWFGEVTVQQNGMFHTELRGLTQALTYNFIESFSPECRADFCDHRCKLNKADFSHRASVKSAGGSRSVFTANGLPLLTTGTSVGGYKDWRIVIVALPSQSYGGLGEFKAWDQAGNEITGGSTDASSVDLSLPIVGDIGVSVLGSGHGSADARDNKLSTYWRTDEADLDDENVGIPGSWWAIHFSSKQDIKEFLIRATPDKDYTPTTFRLEYSDDDHPLDYQYKQWTLAKTCTMNWTEGNQSAVWGIGSATSDPISLPTGNISVPPPYSGASAYVGGTIEFTTGQNAGKVIEIAGHDSGTNVVTLFTEMPFPIQPGDTFKLVQGCDKTRETCKLYNNIINFRGEPDVPGQDEYLRYPNTHE
jgi:hypothetical protein